MFPTFRVPLASSGYRIESTVHKDSIETIYLAYALEGNYTEKPLILKHIALKSFPIAIDRNCLSLSGVFHDSIITTFECFYENEDLWAVMPYFASISLQKILKTIYPEGVTDRSLVCYLLRSVLTALDRIHSSSAVVKALKPSKVLINREGHIKVLDCQISGRIREEMCKKGLVGPNWTSPEVINGGSGDLRSDIWSFGIVVLELVTGKNPWENYPPLKTSVMISAKNPPKIDRNVNCDSILRDIVHLCLQKDPQKRPTTTILLENSYFRKVDPKKTTIHNVWKLFDAKETKNRKIMNMPQPKQIVGEDPDEMLMLEEHSSDNEFS